MTSTQPAKTAQPAQPTQPAPAPRPITSPLITAKNLSLSYGQSKVIASADFTINEQDFVCVVGANGSGKTRFCNELMASHRGKAYRLSALKALFPINSDKEPLEGSIDAMFQHINDMSPQVKNSANTEFDRLT